MPNKQRDADNPRFIKVGRIGKTVEERMGIALTNDVSIYLSSMMAESFAREYPSSYLSLIEEIGKSIKKPDAFAYNPQSEEILFLRLYPRQEELFLLKTLVGQNGHPRKWVVRKFSASKSLEERSLKEAGDFFRGEVERKRKDQ